MKSIHTPCALCGDFEGYTVLHEKNFGESDINEDIFSARRLPDRVHYRIVRCNKDGLIRSNPVLDDQAMLNLYRKSKFTYREETKNLARTYLDAMKDVLSSTGKGSRILEIGCGNGFLLSELYGLGYRNVFGIEPSADAAGKADERVRSKITVDVLKPGIFEPRTFDLIFFFQTLDHVRDPNGFLALCFDLLVPGGVIGAFNHDAQSLQARLFGERSPIIDIEHVYLFDRATIEKIFRKNNFLTVTIFSPANIVSLKYLMWLLPAPRAVKMKLLEPRAAIARALGRVSIKVKLGNVCIIARRPS